MHRYELQQKYWNHFIRHKNGAKTRGIPFLLTFKQWFDIWYSSGHLPNRGRNKGQYVMARHKDQGAYTVGNVLIILAETNVSEGQTARRKAARKEKDTGGT